MTAAKMISPLGNIMRRPDPDRGAPARTARLRHAETKQKSLQKLSTTNKKSSRAETEMRGSGPRGRGGRRESASRAGVPIRRGGRSASWSQAAELDLLDARVCKLMPGKKDVSREFSTGRIVD